MAENTDEPETQAAAPEGAEPTKPEDLPAYGEDESQEYVDRSKLDFDPEDGLYTGTAVTGDSDIPNPDDVAADEGADAGSGGHSGGDGGSEPGAGSGDNSGEDSGAGNGDDESDDSDRPKPYPHDGNGPDAASD